MQRNPHLILIGLSILLWLGAQNWRRRKLKRAVRDLPTRMQRLLGPEPSFDPPSEPPEALAPYATLHASTRRVEWVVRGLALLWLAYVLYLELKGLSS
ncbi:hypothetical protein [Thetidibacter halocola]|uniref:Uncharacterized protein n=1 Tax=Thetidibacter halocola TaxID=2827239 RepID=A0A8J7WJK9_9RHOB|nr:hypothetical protein [Thetidibacter halocola]MBS0126431.1 hypothetical protein [Thetidibacter halocola]